MRALLMIVGATLLSAAVSPYCAAQSPEPAATLPPQSAQVETNNEATPELPLRDRSFFDLTSDRRTSFNLIGQFASTWDDNALGAQNQSGDDLNQFSFLAMFTRRWARGQFRADYAPSVNRYVRFDGLNFVSHEYDQELTYELSARSAIDWTTRASRYSSRFSTYVDPTDFGGLGLSLPDTQAFTGANQYITTGGQSQVEYRHAISAADTISFSVMGGISRFVPTGTLAGPNVLAQSLQQGGFNFFVRHDLTPKINIGARFTSVYTRQTGPVAHQFAEAYEGTYAQKVGKWNFEVAGGPLIRQATLNSPLVSGNTWAFNAGVQRMMRHSDLHVMYSRSLDSGLAEGVFVSNRINGTFRQYLSRRLFASAAGSYEKLGITNSDLTGFVAQGDLGYHIQRDTIFFMRYLHGQQDAAGAFTALGYRRNQYSIGIAYNFSRTVRGE